MSLKKFSGLVLVSLASLGVAASAVPATAAERGSDAPAASSPVQAAQLTYGIIFEADPALKGSVFTVTSDGVPANRDADDFWEAGHAPIVGKQYNLSDKFERWEAVRDGMGFTPQRTVWINGNTPTGQNFDISVDFRSTFIGTSAICKISGPVKCEVNKENINGRVSVVTIKPN
ncbi:hypothetical protein [Streptomyces vinaceus]|uniref:hypothetical protein n=1 Tax=Streptomyces vinaceus TaxID=1960 RepID=UPI0036C33568